MECCQISRYNKFMVCWKNPNTTAPTDRPATSNVLYVGTDASLWIWNGTFIYKFNRSKSTNSNNKNFYHKYGCFRFSNFFKNELLYIILYQYLLQLEWDGTSTGTVNLEVSPTNSATPASWIVNGSVSNSQSLAGLLTLTSIQVEGAQTIYICSGWIYLSNYEQYHLEQHHLHMCQELKY